jgi:hypothetical protein
VAEFSGDFAQNICGSCLNREIKKISENKNCKIVTWSIYDFDGKKSYAGSSNHPRERCDR